MRIFSLAECNAGSAATSHTGSMQWTFSEVKFDQTALKHSEAETIYLTICSASVEDEHPSIESLSARAHHEVIIW